MRPTNLVGPYRQTRAPPPCSDGNTKAITAEEAAGASIRGALAPQPNTPATEQWVGELLASKEKPTGLFSLCLHDTSYGSYRYIKLECSKCLKQLLGLP